MRRELRPNRLEPWSVEQMPALEGTRVVVTGANAGIGLATTRELARAGAAVVMACRSTRKGEASAAAVRADVPGADIRVRELDLASLASVRQFADAWDGPLDLLVNNAGVAQLPKWSATADGFEMQFGTNHLGHFALTGLLLPRLLASANGRVVTVGSITHKNGDWRALDANPRQGYRSARSYAQSKLANVAFALELHERAAQHGVALTSVLAHPGVAATEVASSRRGLLGRIGPPAMKYIFQSASAGAQAILYAATVAEPGSCTGPQRLFESRGPIGPARVNPVARDPQFRAGLWELSERLTGVTFDWGTGS